MKVLCDVCDKNEASLFCVADEAALCAACDHRVHHANKLAGKHQRFSLHHPSPKNAPICDICQERRAFLFCRQDRAILCRDCDLSIHRTNQHTQKHTRFLLTGLKLSATSALYSPLPEPSDTSADVVLNKADSINETIPESNDGNRTSSISEYLIEMLPGWRVEELLDSSFPYNGFCKSGGDNEGWVDHGEKNGVWVPQFATPTLNNQTQNLGTEMVNNDIKSGSNLNWYEDTSFVVPQMSQPFKNLRTLW